MNKRINNRLFSISGCLTQDVALRYIDGRLSEAEKLAVDEHLSNCLLCTDAVEGLTEMAVSAKPEAVIEDLRRDVANVLTKKNNDVKNNRRTIITWSAAAAIVAVIFLSWFSLTRINEKQENKTISENLEKSPAPEVSTRNATQADSVIAITENIATGKSAVNKQTITEDLSKSGKKGYFLPDIPDYRWATDSVSLSDNLREDDMDGEKLKDKKAVSGEDQQNIIIQGGLGAEEKKSETKNLEQEVTTVTTDEEAETNYKFDFGIVSGKKKQKEEPGRSANEGTVINGDVTGAAATSTDQLFAEAMALYNAGSFSEAIIKFETILLQQQSNEAARYYCALSYHNTGRDDKAVSYLDKLCKDKAGPFYEIAQWQKALILIDRGDIKQARKTLNQIIAGKGTFSTHAQDKLNELGQ